MTTAPILTRYDCRPARLKVARLDNFGRISYSAAIFLGSLSFGFCYYTLDLFYS